MYQTTEVPNLCNHYKWSTEKSIMSDTFSWVWTHLGFHWPYLKWIQSLAVVSTFVELN